MENYSGKNEIAPVINIGKKRCELNINIKALRYMYDHFVDREDEKFKNFELSSMLEYLYGLFKQTGDSCINDMFNSLEFCGKIIEACSGGFITKEELDNISLGQLTNLYNSCVNAFNYCITDYLQSVTNTIKDTAESDNKKKVAEMMVQILSQM